MLIQPSVHRRGELLLHDIVHPTGGLPESFLAHFFPKNREISAHSPQIGDTAHPLHFLESKEKQSDRSTFISPAP
jgi:hypothetical protein